MVTCSLNIYLSANHPLPQLPAVRLMCKRWMAFQMWCNAVGDRFCCTVLTYRLAISSTGISFDYYLQLRSCFYMTSSSKQMILRHQLDVILYTVDVISIRFSIYKHTCALYFSSCCSMYTWPLIAIKMTSVMVIIAYVLYRSTYLVSWHVNVVCLLCCFLLFVVSRDCLVCVLVALVIIVSVR